MVRKKDLVARIDFLIEVTERLSKENKELQEKALNMSSIITEMTEKVEFLWHQSDYDKKESDNIYDEWLNGSKEGDK